MEKIVVKIDPDLAELIPGYLANREKDIVNILAGLDKKSFGDIRITGHSMKGSGGGYGFDEISRIGAGIEIAAKETNSEQIKSFVGELKTYLSAIEIRY